MQFIFFVFQSTCYNKLAFLYNLDCIIQLKVRFYRSSFVSFWLTSDDLRVNKNLYRPCCQNTLTCAQRTSCETFTQGDM